MKKNIHPQWFPQAKVTCTCGNSFTAGSTLPEIRVDICSKCHPFFTGKMKFIDIQGRVERFQAKQQAAKTTVYIKKKDRLRLKEIKEDARPRTLREMLQQKASHE